MAIQLSDFELNFKSRPAAPVILQTEASECGLACIAMIAGQLGHHITLAALRRRYPSSMNGTTLKRLVEIAGELSLHSRPLRLDVDEAKRLKMPCILHWDMGHFVVLTKISRQGFHINDPAIGKRIATHKEVDEKFTGVAVEIIKGADFRGAKPPPPPSLRELAGPMQGLGRALLTIFGLALCLELVTLISPWIIQVVVDQVLTSADINLLNLIGAGFLFLLCLQVTMTALRTWTTMWISSHFNVAWSNTVFLNRPGFRGGCLV